MWHPSNAQWWVLAVAAMLIVAAWPPQEGKSLALKFVNWVVDPSDVLPIEPGPIAFGLGDDPETVEQHDSQEQAYNALYRQGGWMRKRLELKVASDPYDPSTERQMLTALGVLTALVVWRFSGRTT